MTSTAMNEDLANERARCPVNVEALTHLIDGSEACTRHRRDLQGMVEADPVFANHDNMFMSRPERYRHGLRKARRYVSLVENLDLSTEDAVLVRESLGDTMPTTLHFLMFIPNVEALCDDEQRRCWLPRCRSMEVIGCYAQTELGHGSNVRALETTATFVKETDEFEIHTPSITATKWWPGSLGRTANHAMVIAQLVIDDKRYGIHNFLVPVRGKDHKPLPGVRVGDIGPKIGFNTMDNGFCSFDRVRIPRTNMAMRFQRVDRDGKYISTGSKDLTKIAYITVMQVRAFIVGHTGRALAQAATIATRYSIVRRQGFRQEALKTQRDTHPENQILDYTIQMYRLLPMVAIAYGFHAVGRTVVDRLRRLEKQHLQGITTTSNGSNETMKQFHMASSCLKALCTGVVAEGMEDCRKACGGHGYLQSSGLPELIGTFLQECTVEGENHMLTQQVVRGLLQELAAARNGTPVGSDCAYMARLLHEDPSSTMSRRCIARTRAELRDADVLQKAFEHRALRLVKCVEDRLVQAVQGGSTRAEAWNRALVEIYRASQAHAYLLVFQAFKSLVEQNKPQRSRTREGRPGPNHSGAGLDEATWTALNLLLSLLGLYCVQNDMGDFLEDGYLDGDQAGWVRNEMVEVLHLIRPSAISLVDAWDFSDFQLNSALGRYDGQIYEALLETTKMTPLGSKRRTRSTDFEGCETFVAVELSPKRVCRKTGESWNPSRLQSNVAATVSAEASMHASKRAIETTILEAPAKFRSQAGCGAPKQQRKDPTNTHVAGAETLRETSRGGGTCHASQAHEEDAKPSPVATGTEFSTHCEDKSWEARRRERTPNMGGKPRIWVRVRDQRSTSETVEKIVTGTVREGCGEMKVSLAKRMRIPVRTPTPANLTKAPSPASTPAEDVPSTSSETRYSSSSNHPPPLSRRDDATSLPKDSSAPCIGSRIRVRGVFQDGQENSTTTAQKASGLDSPKVKRHKAHFRGMPVSTSIQYLRGDGMGWDVCRVTCDVLQDPVQLYQKRTRDFDGDADKGGRTTKISRHDVDADIADKFAEL